jgi:uncharacterized delta-60 repeat protein
MTVAQRAAVAAALVSLLLAPAAAAAPGDLDPSFGGDGQVTAFPGGLAIVSDLALAGDRIVAAGMAQNPPFGECWDVALAAWTADGTPDASLDGDGLITPSIPPCSESVAFRAEPEALAVAPDGRLFTGGAAQDYTPFHADALVTAHSAAGAFDPSFSSDGWLRDEFREGRIHGLVRLADGRLVAGGYRYGIGRTNWEVHRYLPDGSPDPAFEGDGAAIYPWQAGGPNEEIRALVADGADGAVVAAGGSTREAGSPDARGIAIGRILDDGSLDPAFGTNGRTRVEPGGDPAEGNDVVRTADGGFVVAGTTLPGEEDAGWVLVKFDASGEVDATFGADGVVTGPAGAAHGVAVDSAGRLIVAGLLRDAGLGVARYLVNGAIDETFGSGGLVALNADVTDAPLPPDVVVQPDDRILLSGTTWHGTRGAMSVFRLLADGGAPGAEGTDTGEAGSDGEIGTGAGTSPVESGPVPNRQGSTRRVTIRILSSRVTKRGVLVRVTWPRGTEGTARARLWTRNKGILLGQRTVVVLKGTTSRRFRVPLNRRAKRLLRGGRLLKVRATVRVTGLPAR